jgi:hypothetical protein
MATATTEADVVEKAVAVAAMVEAAATEAAAREHTEHRHLGSSRGMLAQASRHAQAC